MNALTEQIEEASVTELEKRRGTILNNLDQIARLSMNSGVGRIGFRSEPHDSSEEQEWIQIEFDETVSIDKIILIPALWRDAELGFVADGFPAAFSITAGKEQFADGTEIASFDAFQDILPRIAPLIVEFDGVQANWIRVTATRLNRRNIDGSFALQFSEILVYDGFRNVALGQKVTAKSVAQSEAGAWKEEYSVDGFMPYLMDAAEGKGSVAYVNAFTEGFGQISYTIDLLEPFSIDHLILHVVEQTDTVPQAFPGDFGVPYKFILEGSLDADFSNPVVLLEYERERELDVGPIMSFNFEPFKCRYVRLTAQKPYQLDGFNDEGERILESRLGFAEVELLSKGRNITMGKVFDPGYETLDIFRSVDALTDGNNLYGRILDIQEWLDQLAIRHDLLVELPLVNRQLEHHYARQKVLLQAALMAIVVVIVAVVMLILVTRAGQQKAIFRTRERITADLHDLLGGNISAITLLSELARTKQDDAVKLNGYLHRIETLAARTRNALKYVSDMLNQTGLYENLFTEFQRVSKGLTEGLEHELQMSGEQYVTMIEQRKRVDIFLFYKECLINVIRHASASKIVTCLKIDERMVHLKVCDNGVGISERGEIKVPNSLRRRARIMGAQVNVRANDGGGCCVFMEFHWNRSLPRRLIDKAIRARPE